MTFHVPFEHRRRGQPIYIGFDVPPTRVRTPRNWFGFFGFGLSIFAILTAGVLSPIALLFSLIGMRRQPRRLATAGTVLGTIGTLMLAGVISAGVFSHSKHQRHVTRERQSKVNRVLTEKTSTTLKLASKEFEEYSQANDGNLPAWIDANMVAIKHQDAWGESLRFDAEKEGGKLRSAGADHRFDTKDDVILKVEGNCSQETQIVEY